MSVAYLGPKASYTHQAALTAFPPGQGLSHDPFTTIPKIFQAVQNGAVRWGVVPFYNTTFGAVVATLDSFLASSQANEVHEQSVADSSAPPRPHPLPATRIVGEIVVPIKHNLLGYAGFGQSVAHVKRVYSHEQALGQCAEYLSQHLPNAEQVSVTSTSRAAELVAASKPLDGHPSDVVAISSHMAAEEYSVPILQAAIQDRDDNKTHFFIIERCSQNDASQLALKSQEKTLLLVLVSHSIPGALFKALETIFKHFLNMTGIHQRPPAGTRQEDAIFVEVGGLVNAQVLHDLRAVSVMAVNLGTW